MVLLPKHLSNSSIPGFSNHNNLCNHGWWLSIIHVSATMEPGIFMSQRAEGVGGALKVLHMALHMILST